MRKTNVGIDSERDPRKKSPALEVVTHRRLNRKFGPAESRTPQIGLNLGVTDQLQNRTAGSAIWRTTLLVRKQVKNCCAQVIPCHLIYMLTLRFTGNNGQAKNMVLVGNRIYAEVKQVDAGATEFTGDIAIQLKAPSCNNHPQRIQEHPGG